MSTQNTQYNYIVGDIILFTILIATIGVAIGGLYWHDLNTNIFSDIARDMYSALVQ